jgi:hypothetical protein
MDTTNFNVNGTIYSPGGSGSVPEPATFALIGSGLLLAGAFRKLRRRL